MTRPGLRFLLFVVTLCAFGFRDVIWSACAIFFEYHNHPRMYWWGTALPALRWTFLIAGAAALAFVVGWNRHDAPRVLKSREFWLAAGLVAIIAVRFSTKDPDEHVRLLTKDAKSLLILAVIAAGCRTPGRMRVGTWMILIGIAGFGVVAFLNPIRTAGRYSGVGGPDSEQDNHLAAHVALFMPLLVHYMVAGRKFERVVAIICGAFSLNLLVLTSSRGGFLAFVVGCGYFVAVSLTQRATRRWAAIIAICGLMAFVVLADDIFFHRLKTLVSQEDERAAFEEYAEGFTGAGRTIIWSAALDAFADYPLGLGGGGFKAVSQNYTPDMGGFQVARGTHNTYLQGLTDYGVFYFLLMLLTLLLLWRRCRGVRREHLEIEGDPGGLASLSLAMQASLLAMCASFMFGNYANSSRFYWMIGFVCGLHRCSEWIQARRAEGEEGQAAIALDGEEVSGMPIRRFVMLTAGSLILFF